MGLGFSYFFSFLELGVEVLFFFSSILDLTFGLRFSGGSFWCLLLVFIFLILDFGLSLKLFIWHFVFRRRLFDCLTEPSGLEHDDLIA